MPAITIRNVEESVKEALRVRAARHGRSMEQEVREILRAAVTESEPLDGIGTAIHKGFRKAGGFEMPAIPRDPIRTPPSFDE